MTHPVEPAAHSRRKLRTPPGPFVGPVAAIAAVGFAVLATVVAAHPGSDALDRSAADALSAPRGSLSFHVFNALTNFGSLGVVALVAVAIALTCWAKGYRRLGVIAFAAPGLAGFAEIVVKPLVRRTRPATRSLTGEHGFSFPSGHATGATALAIAVVAIVWTLTARRDVRTLAIVLGSTYAATIAVSRVVVGAHYATDVVGGLLLATAVSGGVVLALALMPALKRPAQREVRSPGLATGNGGQQSGGRRPQRG